MKVVAGSPSVSDEVFGEALGLATFGNSETYLSQKKPVIACAGVRDKPDRYAASKRITLYRLLAYCCLGGQTAWLRCFK